MQLDDKLALIAALTTKLLLSYTNEKEQQQQHQAQQQQQQQLLEEYKEFLSSLLDIMLRGKNDNFENEQRMIQSISIYKKIIKGLEQIHQSKALRLSRLRQHNSNSSKNNNSNSNSKPLVHEETLIYAVRKKYTDKYMIQLMNILLDAIEDYNYNNDSNHNHNHNDDDDAAATEVKVKHKVVDGRRILGLALIYGNVGATRVLIQRYPQALAIKDALRGQLPLHVACDTEMIVDDEEDDEEDDHNGNVNVNADTDYIGMNISGDGDNLIHNDSTDDQTQTTTWSFATASTINTSNHHRRQRQKQRQNLTNTMKKKYRQAKLIHLLICHGIKNNVGSTYGGAGGIYEQDDSGTSPLMTLIHSLNNPFTWDDVNDDDDDGNNDDNNDDDDDDDEFFGNQSSDESYTDDHSNHNQNQSYNQSHNNNKNEYGTMSQYESKSEQEKYRKLGYHESFDINKDLKLQQGFDDGYDETMEYAFKIGTLLGQGVFETELNEIIKNDDDEDEIPLIVRQYLEKEQVKDGSSFQTRISGSIMNGSSSSSSSRCDDKYQDFKDIESRLQSRLEKMMLSNN